MFGSAIYSSEQAWAVVRSTEASVWGSQLMVVKQVLPVSPLSFPSPAFGKEEGTEQKKELWNRGKWLECPRKFGEERVENSEELSFTLFYFMDLLSRRILELEGSL